MTTTRDDRHPPFILKLEILEIEVYICMRSFMPDVRKLYLILLAFIFTVSSSADDTIKVASDSSNFVTASILIVSPTDAVYSVFGHSAIRMQCPSKGLDYCFTFEMDSRVYDFLKFFAGKAEAGFVAVPTSEFLKYYSDEGRGIEQYTLNLTPHEKQELWRALDNSMMDGAHRKFNLLQNNCTSMSIFMIESVLANEEINFGKMPTPMYYKNGIGVRFLSRKSPWAQFLFMTFMGTESDQDWDIENKLSPELMIPVLKQARIVNLVSRESRPVLTGDFVRLLPLVIQEKPCAASPTIVFALLLLCILVLTYGEWRWKWQHIAKYVDIALLAMQTLAGIILLYVTFVSGLFGLHWNWYLIPFNPLPAACWLIWKNKKNYYRLYGAYAVIGIAFMLIAPLLTSQVDLPHLLLVATLVVRCLSNYFIKNKQK